MPPDRKFSAVAPAPPAPPVIFQTPVNVPDVVAFPVLIEVVKSVPTVPVVAFKLAIAALDVTVMLLNIPEEAVTLPLAFTLEAEMFPVTVIAPKVVDPLDEVEVNDSQFDALVVPVIGQTYKVLLFVLNQSCPCRGLAGGVVEAKFSSI
jgi:hypothetical protein